MNRTKASDLSAALFLILTGILCFISGRSFQTMHRPEPVFPSAGLTATHRLSDYFPPLKNTHGDTEVYIFRGTEEGGNLLVLGGTHPNRPAGPAPPPAITTTPARQKLSGNEVRNLNRCYPGRADGFLTEKIAFGIMELIRREHVDIGVDLHESAPDSPGVT